MAYWISNMDHISAPIYNILTFSQYIQKCRACSSVRNTAGHCGTHKLPWDYTTTSLIENMIVELTSY